MYFSASTVYGSHAWNYFEDNNNYCLNNPRCMCKHYGSCSVCMSVTFLAATYLICESKMRCYKVPYGIPNAWFVCISLKPLCLSVLASFADAISFLTIIFSKRYTTFYLYVACGIGMVRIYLYGMYVLLTLSACVKGMVVILCVCSCVSIVKLAAATYLDYTLKTRCC